MSPARKRPQGPEERRMASSFARADLKREQLYTWLIVLIFIIAFLVVFKPIRPVRDQAFVPVLFNYRYDQPFGPSERQKEAIQDELRDAVAEAIDIQDIRVSFPSTTEVRVRVPLDQPEDVAEIDRRITGVLDDTVPKRQGERVASAIDATAFGDDPLFTFAGLGIYPLKLHINRGLDLQGGVHLVLQARRQNVEFEYSIAQNATELRRQLDALGGTAEAAEPTEPTEATAAPAEPGEPTTEPAEAAEAAEAGDTPATDTPADLAADAEAGADTASDAATDTVAGAEGDDKLRSGLRGERPLRMAQADPGAAADAPATEPTAEPAAEADAEPVDDATTPAAEATADDAAPTATPDDEAGVMDDLLDEPGLLEGTDGGLEPIEGLDERTISADEARRLADPALQARVVERLEAFVAELREKYQDRLGEIDLEVISSNIVILRTYVDPKLDPAEQQAKIRDHGNILGNELRELFPQTKSIDDPAVQDIGENALQQVEDVITRRVDRLGVSEANVFRQGEDRIVVELPGLKDPDEAVELLGTTARLEFRKIPERYRPDVATEDGRERTTFVNEATGEPVPTDIVYYEAPEFAGNKNVITGSGLKPNSATVTFEQSGQPAVSLELKGDAAKRFDQFAADNLNEFLGIFLDKEAISAPQMEARRFGGQVQIHGGFTMDEAKQLQVLLNAGALPLPVDVVEQRVVSATLGADTVHQSEWAALMGLVLVIVSMAVFYRFPGMLADLSLIFYGMLVLMVLVLLNATLTLPGILGLVLSIGMAVDANVIVFERLREEMRGSEARPIHTNIRNSYERAWAAILDGNVTTALIAGVLYWIGTGPVRGFAITLLIGIVCSLFSALFVTRRFQNLFAATRFGQNRDLYRR